MLGKHSSNPKRAFLTTLL